MSKQVYTYSTAEERYNEHLKRVGDDADTNIEFMTEESLLDAINTIERQIWNAPFSGMEIDRERRITVPGNGRGWDFAEDDFPVQFFPNTTTEAALTKGYTGNVALADGSDFPNEVGAVVMYDKYGTWDYITYQSRSGTSPDFTLVTLGDVTMAHESGEEINLLYKLPTDFARSKLLKVYGDEWHEGKPDPEEGFYSTYKGFLWMPRSIGECSGILEYFKQRTALTDLANTLNIPDILNPVLDNLLDARAFKLGGESESMVSDALFAAADALRSAMGYTTTTSNKRIRLARPMPRSPTWQQRGQMRASNFDQGNYD